MTRRARGQARVVPALFSVFSLVSLALVASCRSTKPEGPPAEKGPFRPVDLVELVTLDPTIRLDVRYATSRNFTGRPVYTQPRAFLQRPAAEALVRAHRRLGEAGLGLWVFDGYRPWRVTKLFWDVTPADKRIFVADPAQGSRHNRGCAVDVTLYDRRTGAPLPMPGDYDEMTERSHAAYTGGTPQVRANRDRLRAALEAEGFRVYEPEWWHYDFQGYREYPILDVPFEELGAGPGGSR